MLSDHILVPVRFRDPWQKAMHSSSFNIMQLVTATVGLDHALCNLARQSISLFISASLPFPSNLGYAIQIPYHVLQKLFIK